MARNDGLRDYQQEMKLRLFEEWELHRSVMVQMSTSCAVSSVAGEISTSAAGSAARVSSAAAAHPDSVNTMPNATIDFFIKTTPFILGVVAYTIGLSAFNHKIYRSSCPRCRLSV